MVLVAIHGRMTLSGRKLGKTMQFLQTLGLFILTAVAEIVGCYLPWLWLKKEGSIWLLVPAALSLAAFAWLLTLHPQIAGRTYAAYGGVYVAVAVIRRSSRPLGRDRRGHYPRWHDDYLLRSAKPMRLLAPICERRDKRAPDMPPSRATALYKRC